MGSIAGNRVLTRFEKTKPGELVRFTLGPSGALGIVLMLNEDQDALVGLLSGGYEELPQVQWRSSTDRCVSYGSDWVIEPIEGKDAHVSEEGPGRRAGVLALSSRGWLMNFATSAVDPFGRFNWEWRDLATFEEVQRPGHVVYYNTWSLWQSESERAGVNAQAVFQYTADEQVGRQLR